MSTPIRFAQISDTHIGPSTVERSQVLVEHLAEIQAGGYDFVIHTGDLMDEPSAWAARAVKALVSQLRMPIYFVPGNHDVYNAHMGEIDAPWWAKLEVDSNLEAQYQSWFGPSWHSRRCGGLHLVGIDSLLINSGLPEEAEQWAWLEATLADLGGRNEKTVLFTHLPLFINRPEERLDGRDFANRYLVIAPPGRDRLLGLVRQYRVTAVLSGHIHAPWQKAHSWLEESTTQFVCTGSSGMPSAMAISQFNLPLSPEEGLGYHEHWIGEEGLSSRYHRYVPAMERGPWTLGPVWSSVSDAGRVPSMWEGKNWYDEAYQPTTPEWQDSIPVTQFALASGDGGTQYVRQTFEAETDAVSLYLELLTERVLELYLNGELVIKLEAMTERPPAWRSAGGTYTIDSPKLELALPQRLVRRGQNRLAWCVSGEPGSDRAEEEYVAYRNLGRD